jgi:hypothetical protein
MYFEWLTVPSVLFYVVAVTAEVASSSLVVPAIPSKRVALIPFFPRSELFYVTHSCRSVSASEARTLPLAFLAGLSLV